MGKGKARKRIKEQLALESGRLDRMQLAHWPAAMRGEPEATRAVLDVMERRSRLLGLDLQPRHGPDPDAEIDQILDGLTEDMDPATALAEIKRILREGNDSQSQ